MTARKPGCEPGTALMDRPRIGALIVLAAGAVLFLTRVNSSALSEPDEGRYAEVAREMLASGDYVTPRYNGVRYLAKPPLLFWVTAGSFAILKPSEFAARLPSKLAAIGCMFACYLLGRAMFGNRVGLLSALVLGTSVLYYAQGQIIRFDSPLVLLLVLAFLLFWRSRDAPSPAHRVLYWFFMYAALAAATLTKGPAFVVIVALTMGAYCVVARALGLPADRQDSAGWRLTAGSVALHVALVALAFGAIAMPWYLAAERANPGFLRYFLLGENLQRAATSWDHPEPWWYFIAWTPALFLPWTASLPLCFWAAWRDLRERRRASRAWVLCLAWMFVCLVAFSASKTKLQVYMLPAMPPLALMAAKALADAFAPEADAHIRTFGRATLIALGASTIVLAAAGAWYLHTRFATEGLAGPVWMRLVLACACVGLTGAAFVALQTSNGRAAVLLSCCAAGATMVLLGGLVEAIGNQQSVRPLAAIATLEAQRVKKATGQRGLIVIYGSLGQMRGAPFYTSAAPCRVIVVDKMPKEWRFDEEEARTSGRWFEKDRITDFVLGERPVWCLTLRDEYTRLLTLTGDRYRVLGRHGKMLLFTNARR